MNERNREKLANLFIEFSKNDTYDYESAKAFLIEKEVDVDSFVERGLSKIKKIQAKQNLATAKKRSLLLEKAKKLLEGLKESSNTTNVKDAVLRLFGTDINPEMQLFFNNIQNLEEEDANLMLDNAKLLEIIDKLEDTQKDDSSSD